MSTADRIDLEYRRHQEIIQRLDRIERMLGTRQGDGSDWEWDWSKCRHVPPEGRQDNA